MPVHHSGGESKVGAPLGGYLGGWDRDMAFGPLAPWGLEGCNHRARQDYVRGEVNRADEEGHGQEDDREEGHGDEGHNEEGHGDEGHNEEGHGDEGHNEEGHGEEGHNEEGHNEEGHNE